MKSVFFECSKHITPFSLLAKVDKSVGFGSAERCSDDDNDNENLRIKHCKKLTEIPRRYALSGDTFR